MTNTPRPGHGHYLRAIFIAGDLAIINLVFGLTLLIFHREAPMDSRTIRELWLLVNVCYIPALVWTRMSHERRAIRMEYVMRTVFLIVTTHALFFLALLSFLHIPDLAGRLYLSFYGMMLAAVFLFHTLTFYKVKEYRRKGFNFARVVIVGTGPTAERLYECMKRDAGYGYRVLGFFDDNPAEDFRESEVLPVGDLEQFVIQNGVRQIFYTLSGHSSSLQRVIKIADDHVVDFYYVPQIPRTLSRRFELHNIGSTPVLSLRRNPLKSVINRAVKRSFDFVLSSVFLVFYPLIYIPVAIGIKISSPGPVYFKQERTGYLGRSFTCYKFRTMRVNAGSDRQQATANDPRKTKLGDFLRRTSLDELPQFINVWRGDMSIVGPRPHMLKHTEDYTRLVDRYMVRHAVKPGITGWAQVNGYRGITDELWKMERRVEHDVWYIENWSFLLDIKIMFRTVINALGGEENAF